MWGHGRESGEERRGELSRRWVLVVLYTNSTRLGFPPTVVECQACDLSDVGFVDNSGCTVENEGVRPARIFQ